MTTEEYTELIESRKYTKNGAKNCFLSFNSADNVIVDVVIGSYELKVKFLDIKINESSNMLVFSYEPIGLSPFFSSSESTLRYDKIIGSKNFITAMNDIFPEINL